MKINFKINKRRDIFMYIIYLFSTSANNIVSIEVETLIFEIL